ncbi:hypothetical protein Tco_0686909 [Tanacetum coccineum]
MLCGSPPRESFIIAVLYSHGWACAFHQDEAIIRLRVTSQQYVSVSIIGTTSSRGENMSSVANGNSLCFQSEESHLDAIIYQLPDGIHVMTVEEEYGEWICFLGSNSASKIKKYRGLNSSDGGNIRDRVKIAGGVIGSGDEIEFSEELKELLPAEAGK